MRRMQQITGQVREVLAGTIRDGAAPEQVAIQYSEEVRAVSMRLSHALELARRGLWMELRSVVDAQPPLLQAVDVLQFETDVSALPVGGGSTDSPEVDLQAEEDQLSATMTPDDFDTAQLGAQFGGGADLEDQTPASEINSVLAAAARPPSLFAEQWRTFCRDNGLEVAPEIATSLVDEVRGALRRASKPRFELLHRHYRRQCLSLASLESRMETLRLITRRDKGNAIWGEELQRLEVARIDELRRDLDAALSAGKLADADEILDHLHGTEWRDPHAARRVVVESEARLNQAWGHFASQHAKATADAMYAHYMAEAVEQVESQSRQWSRLCERLQRVGMQVPEGPAATVAPILDWLRRRQDEEQLQRERRAARESLERLAVDSSCSPSQLNDALIAAEAVGCDVPPTLRDVVQSRVRAHSLQQRNWRRLKVALIGATATAVLAAGVWGALALVEQKQRNEHLTQLEGAIERRDAQEVERLSADADALRRGFMAHERAVAALALHKQLSDEESVRDAQFEEALASAGDPENASVSRTAVETAASLARTDEQRERVARWRQVQLGAESREQARKTAAFIAELRALSSRIDELERQDLATPQARKALEDVEGALGRLGSVSGISADASSAFTAQRKRVGTMRTDADSLVRADQERRDEAAQIAALEGAVNDPDRLCRLLGEFAARFPQSPYAAQFAEVAGQCGPTTALVRWNETAAQISSDPFPAGEAERTRIRGILQRYRAANPSSPVGEAVRRYEDLLADSSAWTQWLLNTLRTWTPLETNQVTLKSGVRLFYDMKDRPITRGTESSIYMVWKNWKAGDKQSQVISLKEISSDGASPQFALRERIEKIIGGRAARTDGMAALQVVQAIRDDAKVDPIARATLIEGLLPHVLVALPTLKQQIDRSLELLGQLNLAAVDWMTPCVPESRREHGKVVDALRLDVPVESWIADRKLAMDAVRDWLKGKLRPVGIVDTVDPNRPLRLAVGARLQPGEGLFTVNASASLLQIGKVGANGAPVLDGLPRTQPSGSLVFAGADRIPRPSKGAK